ncbi:MAG: endonuclease, partial [Thermodesulfovibrio sp.]|nr:endonuclease [Thermodesulfovibrio sp.]
RFINHPAFKDIPLILETPKKSKEDDPGNLRIVRGLLKAEFK